MPKPAPNGLRRHQALSPWSLGSAGTYSFSHCLEDTEAVLSYLATGGTDRYAIDPLRVFLLGHSNGGNTVINVAKRHPELRGVIAYCPFDHKGAETLLGKEGLASMLTEAATVLHIESPEALVNDSETHRDEWAFPLAAYPLKDQNILIIGGEKDTTAPPQYMIDPFWNLLTDQQSQAIHQRVDLLGNHSLDTCRLKLIETVGTFIESLS